MTVALAPKIVYVSIGNSDERLTDEEWLTFRDLVHKLLTEAGGVKVVHGAWQSFVPKYVNACWCIEPIPEHEEVLKETLRIVAKKFRQRWIAWAVAETEVLEGVSAEGAT